MIYIDNRQNLINITEEFNLTIKEIIDWALKSERVRDPYQVSLVYVDNEEIAVINNEHRGINAATDVLSFPMLDYPKATVYKEAYGDFVFDDTYLDQGELVLGDIVISLQKAKEQSQEFDHSFIREVCYLTIHSVLHLLGYDHMEEIEKKIMREREEEILQKFNLAR